MIVNRTVTALLLIAALAFVASPAAAQYMFLDTNGDGFRTSADHLVAGANTVNVYLNTNHNRDGSLATCDVDGTSPLNINSYYVNLSGTNVTYTLLTNQMGAAFATHFATSNPGDGTLQDGYGAQLSVPAGLYKLASLTITAGAGAVVNIVDIIPGSAVADFTGFGTGAGGCLGNDFDNTYKLAGPGGGSDWTDVDGLGPTEIGPPVLAVIGNKTVNEGNCLTFTATAFAPNGNPVTFFLTGQPPVGATITTGGQFNWCQTEAQGPGVYAVTVTVVDNVTQFSDTETIQVTVNEVNVAPVLAAIGDKTVTAGNTLAFTATATDADLPANTLTFSLDPGAPVGAAITAGGNFTWTPTQSQAIANYLITIRVTDNGVPALSDIKSFAVYVPQGEIGAPVVTNPGNKTVNEGSCLNFAITATSAGGGTLTFALGAGAPSGASITPLGGQFTWCPTEAQGPGNYPITVNVSDGFLTGSTIFTVTVLEVNLAPVLNPIGNKQACILAPVTFTATATDADLPVNSLTFSIDPGSFPGATIDPVTGAFSWTAQAGGSFPFTIRVTDNGSPPLSDSETIVITVLLSPPVPVLQQPADMTVAAGLAADQELHAADLCGNPLTFSKVSGPAFVTVTTLDQTTGNVHLAPTAADVGSYTVTVAASNVFLFDRKTLTVTVTPNQALPVLQPILDMTVDEGATASQSITGSDPDNVPLTFSKVSGPLWMTVQTLSPTTGLVVLSPDFMAGGTYQAMVRASNGTAYDQRTFTISVTNICRPPTANAGGPYSGTSGVAVQFNGGGSSDPDGDALTYAWSFGDGDTGSGTTTNHAYASQGTYVVGLTVTDVCALTDDDATTATISTCLTAFFYATGNKAVMINLGSGKPSECLQVEPVLGAFAIEDVDLASIVLRSPNTGSVTEIHALGSKTSVGADRNGNGIDEITACFSKDDLRQLFSNLNATQTVEVTMEGDLVEGGRFCTTQGLSVKAAHGGGGSLAASISPNPLNPSAVLTFSTQERGRVLVQLFDVRGRLLRTLRDEADAAAGYHDVRIDGTTANGTRLSSGVYYVRIRAGSEEERKAITILK